MVSPDSSEAMLRRLRRDSLGVGAACAAVAFVVWPGLPGRGLGVLAGLSLVALAYAGIRAGIDGVIRGVVPVAGDGAPASPPAPGRPRGFVKFFTRHAILAVGAYVMIARFELHPVAMLAGVSAPAVAAAIEFVRIVRTRRTGSRSRSW